MPKVMAVQHKRLHTPSSLYKHIAKNYFFTSKLSGNTNRIVTPYCIVLCHIDTYAFIHEVNSVKKIELGFSFNVEPFSKWKFSSFEELLIKQAKNNFFELFDKAKIGTKNLEQEHVVVVNPKMAIATTSKEVCPILFIVLPRHDVITLHKKDWVPEIKPYEKSQVFSAKFLTMPLNSLAKQVIGLVRDGKLLLPWIKK